METRIFLVDPAFRHDRAFIASKDKPEGHGEGEDYFPKPDPNPKPGNP